MIIGGGTVPRLAPGCRLGSAAGQEDMLLIPEAALRMKGPARLILERCDGTRSVGNIVAELCALFPNADVERIETEAIALLERLHGRGAIEVA
jgi:pyrroloquinoline quinone biosynthesis protein D